MNGSYEARTRRSLRLFQRAQTVFAGGVNHNARYYDPYPLFVRKAQGKCVWDEDDNRYVDYWMGHMALILGHSPRIVTEALEEQLTQGTHYGMSSSLSVELGEEVQLSVPCAELLRFCNSGAEATMYLVRLARGYTGRRTILKMAGGWHGYNSELNKGVHAPFDRTEGRGILPEEQAHVKNIRFNDLEAASKIMREEGKDVAVVLLEPVLGAGGCVPAEEDYLKGLRELADRYGSLLAFDEIITGFRVALGGAQERYGVKPDLATLGKIVGGGLPIGVVCGKKEILAKADPREKEELVSIGGGTFSENPLTMTAGRVTLTHLRKNRARIYERLEKIGVGLRSEINKLAGDGGHQVCATGLGSLFLVHFSPPPQDASEAVSPDKKLTSAYALELMAKGVFFLPGHACALSTAHTQEDVSRLVRLTGDFCEKRTT